MTGLDAVVHQPPADRKVRASPRVRNINSSLMRHVTLADRAYYQKNMREHKLQSGDRRNVRRLLRTSRLWVGGTQPQIPEADMRRPKPRRSSKPQHPAPSPPRTELAKAAGLGRKA